MKKQLVLLAALLCANQAFANETIVLKLSSAIKEETPQGQAMNKFKELAERYTNGRVKVEVGHASAFVVATGEIAALRDNKIQMAVPHMSKMNDLYKSTELNPYIVLDMPYLFKDTKAFGTFAESTLGVEMAKTIDGSGVKLLDFWDNGFKLLSTNKVLNKPMDLKGMSFRVRSSPVIYKMFKVWGAHPREMEFNDMYTAATHGVIDGTENPPSHFTAARLYESQKYLYTTNHAYQSYTLLVNNSFWSTLPAELRNDLNKAVRETTEFERALAKRDNAFALQRAIDTGLVRVMQPSPDLDHFLRAKAAATESALSPLQKEWYGRIKTLLK